MGVAALLLGSQVTVCSRVFILIFVWMCQQRNLWTQVRLNMLVGEYF